jgi:hypothetical protein
MAEITVDETTEKTVKIITKVFSAHVIYQTYRSFGDLKYLFTDPESEWTIAAILLMVQLIWLPTAVFLFSKYYKAGWVLLFTFIVYFLTSLLISAIQNYSDIIGGQKAENIIGTPLIIGYSLAFIILPATIYFLTKKSVRTAFQLTKVEK